MLSQNLWVQEHEGMEGRRGKQRTAQFQNLKGHCSPVLMALNAMRQVTPVTGC